MFMLFTFLYTSFYVDFDTLYSFAANLWRWGQSEIIDEIIKYLCSNFISWNPKAGILSLDQNKKVGLGCKQNILKVEF